MDLGEVDDLLNNMSRHTHVVMEEEQEGNLKRQTNAIHHAREELQRAAAAARRRVAEERRLALGVGGLLAERAEAADDVARAAGSLLHRRVGCETSCEV